MKRSFLFVTFLFLALPFFAGSYSELYSDFYKSGFSEQERVEFSAALSDLENQDANIRLILLDNKEAREDFEKIRTLTSHKMTDQDIKDFQFYSYRFTNYFVSRLEFGKKALGVIITASTILLFIIVFLLRYAMQKEEKYRHLKNLSEISKAVEEATIQTQEAERKALYSTLHDSVSQNTKAEQIFTEKLEPFITRDEKARELYNSIKNIQKENLLQIRGILNAYSNPEQEITAQTIEELCASMKISTGLEIGLLIQNKEEFNELSEKQKTTLYNIIKEALNNAFRHAHAETISVIIRKGTLLIIDDGIGFDQTTVDTSQHHGLEIMKSRATLIGGKLIIKSLPGSGTEISVEW